MRITLTRTGGVIPITKKAEKEVDWKEDEIKKLIERIKTKDNPGSMRDNTTYELSYHAGTFPVDMEKIPAKYKKMFDDLKDNLKIVKPG
jgi:site-specific recombinase XerC